ncbi:MAG: ABC-F family ATP-binding cassette domain-containing protein [Corallococcus sp.]|nr:ABC-F family ATP-binding cassette domain-containing protein [Corallococcus sp.]MCM1359237.1 ABC-F family ATP-binding cassette domain-containing protein [Corallococcus sp.]MCM1394628.1 ABC-F family ATP-binding cassette domain-containing protein [Corallococcus sp.]
MLLQIKSAEFRYGDVTIFENVNLEVNEGDNIGLVGANGAGKSTLLSCIAEGATLFSGSIIKKSGLNIGYLKQNADFSSENTLLDEMMKVFERQTALISQINDVATSMSKVAFDGEAYVTLAEKYHRLTLEADACEAYQSTVKVRTVLNGMGMAQFSDRLVSTLSGGEKTKAALCKLLLQKPELLILDEPTNHLDYKTLDWLETFLSDKKSTLIVVSHDRYFLDRLCTSIWDVQHKKIEAYKGNYTKYKSLKAERRANEQRAFDKQQKEIAKLTDYIARNKVRASTADMAKSREKALQRMEVVATPKRDEQPPRFIFDCGSEPSEFPLTIKNLTLGYDGRLLLNGAELQIRRGKKVALLGLNGTGKSTVMRKIAALDPKDCGKIIFGKNVRVGYYDQENFNLDGTARVIDQLWFDNMRMSQTEVRALLAQVTLGADDVYKKVSELSGGERAKLALALIMAKDYNFLLLDEPTNHLDLPSREALEDALKSYTGTLLFVSHDRYFVNSVADQVAELCNEKIVLHSGNYDDFAARRIAKTTVVVTKSSIADSSFRNAKQRAEQTNRARKIKECESFITQLEAEITALNAKLSDPEIVSDYQKLAAVVDEVNVKNVELEKATAEWERLQEN